MFGGASVGKPAGSFSGREIANFSTSGGKEKEAKKKRLKRLSIAAHDRARGLHAHDSGGVAWTAKKRTRQSIDMYVRDVRAELGACENDGDAAASPPARSPHLPEASRARARDGLDEEGDNIGDENQHSASRRGDVGSLLEVAIGAASSVPGTRATPVTAKFRRFLIAASQPGLRRVRSGDFSPQIARMLGKKQIDEVVKSIASKSKEETLKADLHLKTHVACEVLTREYEQQRKDGVEAAAFANVFGAWFGCCEGVMTPRLRKIAEDDEKAGRHDTPAVAVYRLARSVGAVLEHGGHLVDKSVDDVLSVTVTDDTIFAADGKTHHRHGHVHRAGVSTGETRAHQDHSVAGITVAFSKVLRNVNPSDVAHELQLLHYTYVLNLEGAFHDGFGNGSQVELKARHGSVIRRDRYGDTQRDEVRVMTISPVENAHFMHYIANPKGAARVVIQFVIDAGLGVEWAEAATAYLRRFLGERLEPTEVTKTKMTTAARDFLSKDPNKMKSAELPVSDAAKAEAAVAAAAKKAEEAAAAKKKAEEAAAKKKKIAEEAAAKKKKAEEAAAKKKEEAAAKKKKKIAEDAAAAPAMWAAAAAAAEEAPAKKKKKAEEAAAKKKKKAEEAAAKKVAEDAAAAAAEKSDAAAAAAAEADAEASVAEAAVAAAAAAEAADSKIQELAAAAAAAAAKSDAAAAAATAAAVEAATKDAAAARFAARLARQANWRERAAEAAAKEIEKTAAAAEAAILRQRAAEEAAIRRRDSAAARERATEEWLSLWRARREEAANLRERAAEAAAKENEKTAAAAEAAILRQRAAEEAAIRRRDSAAARERATEEWLSLWRARREN